MGQLDVLRFLHFKGADLFRIDANGENGVHWAARQGHKNVIVFLQQHGLSLNSPNKYGDTPLHLASKHGHSLIVEMLIKHSDDINQLNEEGDTALHLAAFRGNLDTARCLINAGAKTDMQNKKGCTALHLAIHKHHTALAIMLLQSGCNIEILDNQGEAAIHIVAREGLLPMAQTLCAFGCKVEVQNKEGFYPLHLAAKNGHTELVRCLCLAGCNVELKNKDGIVAEITALAQGHNEMANILNRLRNIYLKEEFISQLIPSTKTISKIKLKLFGHSGVGKTTFIDSIKCGYFTSWFKRSLGSMSPTHSKNKKGNITNKSIIELNSSGSAETRLSFDTCYDTYSRGIDIQQVNISGIGNVSIWEFSGHEPYYMTYDNFIGNTNCLHIVFFSLKDEYDIQLQQVLYWLAFLQSRIPIQEPLGFCGKSSKPARIVLIATHADLASCSRVTSTGEYLSSEASSILQVARLHFGNVFDIHDSVFVLDAHVVGSPAIKALKTYIAQCKEKLTQGLPKMTGFLEAICAQLPDWRKSRSGCPSLSWKEFTDFIHSEVNPLAGEEHMKELVQQLQIMGEVLYISCETEDVVILEPAWLCSTIIGYLLSQESLEKARVTGIYSADDIQLLYPEADGLKLLQILEALQLCTKCETEDDVEYEFPCFNMMEMLDGIWSPAQYTFYGGVSLMCKEKPLLGCIFPKIQVNLRRMSKANTENDLYQWCQGSKFCCGQIEGLVTVNGTAYEIRVRGTMKSECFYLQEELITLITQVFADVCPGILLERHALSSSQLQDHSKYTFAYPPNLLMNTLIKDGIYGTVTNKVTGERETLLSILFFNEPKVLQSIKHSIPTASDKLLIPRSKTFSSSFQNQSLCSKACQRRGSLPQTSNSLHYSTSNSALHDTFLRKDREKSPDFNIDQNIVTLALDLHASYLPIACIQCLCAVLDPQDSMGRDWCMLGVLLGMVHKMPKIDPGDNPAFSPTACIFHEWMKSEESSIGTLLSKLKELERTDASENFIPVLPLFKIERFNETAFSGLKT
ncbi:death-associated protein kinase 1 [Parasteatoda tepidariorum]|uniref:death-associated protein kinase 1 n=1 Tax=Parasteatoda tepidariorum TaxID=114398 RepID=UPI0039BD64A7